MPWVHVGTWLGPLGPVSGALWAHMFILMYLRECWVIGATDAEFQVSSVVN